MEVILSNRNWTVKWINEEMKDKICIENDILCNSVRGVYGIFSEENGLEECIYLGKAINIYERLFKGNGHLVNLRKGIYMSSIIKECIEDPNKKMKIRVLKKVPYKYDNFNRDAQRLAFAEYCLIEYYQKINQCLYQVPEGGNKKSERENWEKNKNEVGYGKVD